MTKIKPHQYIQYHNQLKRIAEADKRAELIFKGEATECMTMFSKIKGNYVILISPFQSVSEVTRKQIFNHNMSVKIRSYQL